MHRYLQLLVIVLLALVIGMQVERLARPAPKPVVVICDRAADSTAVHCVSRIDAPR